MPMISDAEVAGLKHALAELVGRSMSSVEFVYDYVQLRFDGPCLTALTLPLVRTSFGVLKPENAGYRDAVCFQIGGDVTAVRVAGDEVGVTFRNGVAVVVSLRDEDYRGPEAINYIGKDGSWVVV